MTVDRRVEVPVVEYKVETVVSQVPVTREVVTVVDKPGPGPKRPHSQRSDTFEGCFAWIVFLSRFSGCIASKSKPWHASYFHPLG